jgi:uncharacterized protein
MPLVFEWDPKKAKANHRKHSVSFDEARTVFDDPLAAIFADEEHSIEENRARRLVLVYFTERQRDRIRIVSARGATRREQSEYEDHCQN